MNVNKVENKPQEAEVSTMQILKRFFESFKKFWWVSLVCCVALTVASFAYFKSTFVPMYRSEVKFTIMPLVSGDASNGASVYSFNYNEILAEQMANTFPHVIGSGIMNDIVINDLQRSFGGSISAVAVANTNIFEVAVTSTSAKDAYDIINSVMENYPKVAEYIVGDTRMTVISEPILATKPYNAGSYIKNVIAFALLGIAVGFVVAFLDMYFRKVIISREDIESNFNGKCICEIPEVKKKRGNTSGGILRANSNLTGFSESIKVLRQRVRHSLTVNKTKVVGVTSSMVDDGKTTVAYNLAHSLSGGEEKVLLIDMNFGNRDIQKSVNRKNAVSNNGIVEVANGKLQLENVINSVSQNFDVLFAGAGDVKFIKAKFVPIFEKLREQYDYIVVDMPTCGVASETVAIADLCDEVLFVTRSNKVSPEKVYDALKDLAFSNAKITGFVLNAVNETNVHYYYGRYGKRRYGYGYGYTYGHYGNEELTANDYEYKSEQQK